MRAPDFWPCQTTLVISLAHVGHMAEARSALARFRVLTGTSSIAEHLRRTEIQPGPERDRIIDGLRKAGLPD